MIIDTYVFKWIAFLIVTITVIFASVWDIRHREVRKEAYIVFALVAMIPSIAFNLTSSILGLILCFLPLFLIVILSSNKLGGGDVKFSAFTGWLLGWEYGLFALLLGSIACVLTVPILRKFGIWKDTTIPLIPFFGGGCVVSFLLKIII